MYLEKSLSIIQLELGNELQSQRGHDIAAQVVHTVALLREGVELAGGAHYLRLRDVIDEDGVPDAGHERHPLLTIASLCGVHQPLQQCNLSRSIHESPYSTLYKVSCKHSTP